MLADRDIHGPRRRCPALHEFRCARLDPVRRQHRPDQTASGAFDPFREGDRCVEFGKTACLIVMRADHAIVGHNLVAGAIGGAEIDAQAQFGCSMRGIGEFLHRLAPGAIEQRGNRQSRGDAVADQARERIRLLERQFVARIHLERTGIHIGLRPDTALRHRRLVVIAKDRRIEIRQRVEIDEARPDQGVAIVDPPRDLTGKASADKLDRAVIEDDFTVLDQVMRTVPVSHDPPCGDENGTVRSRAGLRRDHGLGPLTVPAARRCRSAQRPCRA